MGKAIFVGGLNGSGKSTVGAMLASKLGCPFFEGSTILMRELKIENSYEKLRNLPEVLVKDAFLNSFKKCVRENDYFVIGSHYIKVLDGELSEFTGDWFKYCDLNIHLVTDPDVLLDRIEKDESRGRDRKLFATTRKTKKREFLLKAQKYSLEIHKKICLTYGVDSFIIPNNNDLLHSIELILKSLKYRQP